jgi:CRISPR-associated protein Csc2
MEESRALLRQTLLAHGFAGFLPRHETRLDDVLFLVVNTQRAHEVNIDPGAFRLTTASRTLGRLRELCEYSDLLAYALKTPLDLSGEEGRKLRERLRNLSDGRFEFVAHHVAEVRGLLTNFVHNAAMEAHREQGDLPYLFFPDGVVYLRPAAAAATSVEAPDVAERTTRRIRSACGPRIARQAPGFKFDQKARVKCPEYFADFLDASGYVELVLRQTLRLTARDISSGPLDSMRAARDAGRIPAAVQVEYTPDPRIGSMARLLVFLDKELLGPLDDAAREQALVAAMTRLGVPGIWPEARQIPGAGGFEYRWFLVGARILEAHPGLAVYREEGPISIEGLFAEVLETALSDSGQAFREGFKGLYLDHLPAYVQSVFTDWPDVAPRRANWAGELARYEAAKRPRAAIGVCTLCSADFDADEQLDAGVLFQPDTFKNRLPAFGSRLKGHLCRICQVELMLRQVLSHRALLAGAKFEKMSVRYFTVYPSYFFTLETARLSAPGPTGSSPAARLPISAATSRRPSRLPRPTTFRPLPNLTTLERTQEDSMLTSLDTQLRTEFLHTQLPRFPSGRYAHLVVLRRVESFALFQTDGELNTARVCRGLTGNDVITRLVLFKRKQTSPERLTGRETLRRYGLAAGCEYNSQNFCKQCPDCICYGFAIGDEGAEKAKVLVDSAYSIAAYEDSHQTLTFNAMNEAGIHSGTPQASMFGEQDHVLPQVDFPSIVTVRDPTEAELIYVTANVLRTHRYGAQTSRTGTMRNQLVRVVFADGEIFSNLRLTQAVADRLAAAKPPYPESEVLEALGQTVDSLLAHEMVVKRVLDGAATGRFADDVRDICSDETRLRAVLAQAQTEVTEYCKLYRPEPKKAGGSRGRKGQPQEEPVLEQG